VHRSRSSRYSLSLVLVHRSSRSSSCSCIATLKYLAPCKPDMRTSLSIDRTGSGRTLLELIPSLPLDPMSESIEDVGWTIVPSIAAKMLAQVITEQVGVARIPSRCSQLHSRLAPIAFYGMLGCFAEVIWTGITRRERGCIGSVSLYMFPLYGTLLPYLFAPAYRMLVRMGLRVYSRAVLYAMAILMIEYVYGKILRWIIGVCPWEYKRGMHVDGLIRIDYAPVWGLAAIGLERVIDRVGV
jgi:Putative ABC-transporter type IV